MLIRRSSYLLNALVVVALAFLTHQTLAIDPDSKGSFDLFGGKQMPQEMLTFDVIVNDADGNPIEGAEVAPWALRSSQGHGWWPTKTIGGIEPLTTKTDADGATSVTYPKFAHLEERITSTQVTISVLHPDHPYLGSEHIDVPSDGKHKVTLPAGAAVEVTVTVDGQRDASEEIYAMWTGGRPWANDKRPKVTPDGAYRIPPMAAGNGQVMFLRVERETPTHFSPIMDLEIDPSKGVVKKEVELRPAVTVRGKLSDNVPRPVRDGRVNVQTISPGVTWDEINWFTWAKVAADGSFSIEDWPENEPLQLVALCDGFIAKSGEQPLMVQPERAVGSYHRPQVFLKPTESEVTVEMTPMVTCNIQVQNTFEKPIDDVTVASSPNVGWWNGGAQIYCFPLVRGVEFLRTGKYTMKPGEGVLAQPFKGQSDKKGQLTIQLPAGRNRLSASNSKYQLPVKTGRRNQHVKVVAGEPLDLKLILQPKGLDVLGDWEDLCGLVFG